MGIFLFSFEVLRFIFEDRQTNFDEFQTLQFSLFSISAVFLGSLKKKSNCCVLGINDFCVNDSTIK